MPEQQEQTPVVVNKPTDACTYILNPDGTYTRVDAPTVVPEFAPKE